MPEFQYNTFWPRFWAGQIDWLIFLPIIYLDAWFYSQEFSKTAYSSHAFVSLLGFPMYSVIMHGKYGQTIGKMIMRVQVQSVDLSRLGFKKAIMRDSVIIVISMYYVYLNIYSLWLDTEPDISKYDFILFVTSGWFLLEFITMLTNDKRRAIHDFIAGSVVKRLD